MGLLFEKNRLRRFLQWLPGFIQRYGSAVYLGLLVFLTGVLTVLQISGTSVGVYHEYFYGSTQKDPALIFGVPRFIRSDEFTVSTPWTVAQSYQNYPPVNDLYGLTGQSLLFYDVPVKDFTMFFKPQNWGFVLFPLNQAFAFKWWFRASVFLFSTYLILLRISRRQVVFSIFASLALFFSPYIQWWYSVTMMDIVSANLLILEVLIRMVRCENWQHRILYSVLFAYLLIWLILLFYPPTQIIFGWLFLILAIGFLWREGLRFSLQNLKRYLAPLGVILFAVAIFLAVFVTRYSPQISAIVHTVYPGSRSVNGPGFDLTFLLGGFYNMQLTNSGLVIPPIFSKNQSMASGFFLYGLFLLPVVLFINIKRYLQQRTIDLWTVVLSTIFLLFIAWELWGFPPILARLFLVNSVPAIRVLLALGVFNILLLSWYLFRAELPKKRGFIYLCGVVSVLIALFYLGFSYYLRSNYPGFLFSPIKAIGIPIFIGLTTFLLLQKRVMPFILLLFAFSIFSTYRVNPLYRGLGELNSGSLANAIQSINQSDNRNSRWIIYDSDWLENYLQANAVKSISGVYYYPDLALWRTLDPEGKYNEVYNRYARTLIKSDGSGPARFTLTYTDAMSVSVDPCSQQLVDMDVRYHVFIKPAGFSCLSQIKQIDYPNVSIFIYERK